MSGPFREPRVFSPRPRQLRYLARTLTLLRDHKVETILVWAPVTRARRDISTILEDIRARMKDLSEAHEVPLVDLNRRVALDDHLDFMDDDHLNQRGVDKLMPVFIQVLRDYRLLDDLAGRFTVHRQ